MDVTPTTPKPRPTEPKSNAVKTTTTPRKVAANSGHGRQAFAAEPQVTEARLAEVPAAVSTDIDQCIATTAYFLAAARNFEPGRELEDWLEAERRVCQRAPDRA
jgi:hypothetical protein